MAIIISRCGCGCHRKRQSPVASRRLTGNHKHPWQRADSSSYSFTYSCSISKSMDPQRNKLLCLLLLPQSAPALESCGHFTLLFILLLIFSLFSPLCPSLFHLSFSSLLVFVQSFANYNDSYQSQSSPEGSASPIGRSTGAEQCGVRVAVRRGARHGHLMKRNDNKLFKHYLRFHISVCQAFPSFLLFPLSLSLLLRSICVFFLQRSLSIITRKQKLHGSIMSCRGPRS